MSITKKNQKTVAETKSKSEIEKALAVINAEKLERQEKAKIALDAWAKEFNCTLLPRGEFAGNQLNCGIVIVAN